MTFTGGGWALNGFSATVPAPGARVFVSCDIAPDAIEGRTVRLQLPVSPISGLGMASPNDGPRDRAVTQPAAMTITAIDRITLGARPVPPGTVPPGGDGIVVLELDARSTYAGATKAITGLTVTNRGVEPPGAPFESRDAEVRRLELRVGSAAAPVVATAYYTGGRATFSDFSVPIAPGATSRLVVTAGVSVGATDGMVLGAELADASALEFERCHRRVGALPRQLGRRMDRRRHGRGPGRRVRHRCGHARSRRRPGPRARRAGSAQRFGR